jgi:hypothetical protein
MEVTHKFYIGGILRVSESLCDVSSRAPGPPIGHSRPALFFGGCNSSMRAIHLPARDHDHSG